MDGLDNMAYTGVSNYFQALSTFGYKGYKEVNKLLVLLFIEDLLRSSFSLYIDEEDYKTITNVLYCLFGSTCLIPYPEFAVNTSLVQALNNDILRFSEDELSEDDILRFSEDELLRLVNE